MKRAFLFIALSALTACTSTTTSPVPLAATLGTRSDRLGTMEAAAGRAFRSTVAASSDLLYVGNLGNNSITVYHHDQQGNSSPLLVIGGTHTLLQNPGQLSEDALGNLYVVNGGGTNGVRNAILVFSHGAHGNVKPLRVLAGANTGFHNLGGMTVDKATGKLFVTDFGPAPGNPPGENPTWSSLLRFPPNASGNVAPFARSITEIPSCCVPQIDSDSTADNVIVPYENVDDCVECSSVTILAKQFPNNGGSSASPFSDIWANGLADDPTTKTFLLSGGLWYRSYPSGILRFSESGGQPVSVITSAANCGQLALGYLRNIYAVCGNAIDVFTHDASGNASPLRVLTGPATKLDDPYGIYEGT